MRGLVYLFIVLFSLAIAATAYFGLTFTPIEALLAGLIGLGFAFGILQRNMHQRDMARLERSIQDLSRLLSTDAKAGQNLSQRLNQLVDVDAGARLEVLEADISVLGTVVRQIAESVAEIEENQNRDLDAAVRAETDVPETPPSASAAPSGPVIPLEMLRQAIAEDRLIHHIYPIITLPQRRTHGYDLVPRLMLEDGDLAPEKDFMPLSGGEDLVAEIEALGLVDAITFARRSLTSGEPVMIYAPLSLATLTRSREVERLLSLLDANRAVIRHICFMMAEEQWSGLDEEQRISVEKIVGKGAGFSLSEARSLRLNYAELSEGGVRSVRADAARFTDQPASYTDFHTADIAAYVNRFDVDLIMTNVLSEQHVLTLLDDGIGLAQGPHLAPPGPIKSDFTNSPRAVSNS